MMGGYADFADTEASLKLRCMKENTQTLGVVERLFAQVLSDKKTSTIRWREKFIVPGPLTFTCDGNSEKTVLVEVLRCTEMPLKHVAAFVGRADDWPNEIMLNGMREHYAEIELTSVVQVIEFENPLVS